MSYSDKVGKSNSNVSLHFSSQMLKTKTLCSERVKKKRDA